MKKKSYWLLAGEVLGVCLVAAAVYLAVNLLNNTPPRALGLPFGAGGHPDQKRGGVSIDLVYATEMPRTPPDLVGPLVSKQDNSLFVQQSAKSGDPGAAPVEVVVTNATVIFRNATGDSLAQPPGPGTPVPQVTEPYRVDQINPGDNIVVWGEQRGGRYIAATIMVERATPRPTPAP